MNEPTLIARDLTMVFAAAFVIGLLFWRLRQPLILGYVFAGLILSPFTPGPPKLGAFWWPCEMPGLPNKGSRWQSEG